MRSKYIVIEGLEGAGKTTARNVVVETLEQLGIRDMVFTREPGGTQLAEKLRSLVLDIKSVGDEVITDKAEVLMFYGRDDDRIARMYAHRVEVFHIADGDAVALGIAHYLIFNFLPARDAALHQDLPHP